MQRLLIVIWFLVGVASAAGGGLPGLPAQQIIDPIGDVVVRRTDLGGDGSIGDPNDYHCPDIVLINVGNWDPNAPADDLYTGTWVAAGQFLRIDVCFSGLINPPGPLGFDGSVADPFLYGPHPVYGYIEIDMDASVATGGETWAPGDRYLGNIARFGGKPTVLRFADRVALSGYDLPPSHDFTTPPYVQRSGEEFHIPFLGEDINAVTGDANGNAIFDEAETWLLRGRLFHRAHGYEEFSFAVGPPPGAYEPTVELLWRYRSDMQCTEVTLVYPLTNDAWMAMNGSPGDVVLNSDPNDQNSVHEGLRDLVISAINAPLEQHDDPEWPIIADWAFKDPMMYLDTAAWQITALVAMSYSELVDGGALYVWTDAVEGVVFGDVDGDGMPGPADAQGAAAYIQTFDGDSAMDADASIDGRVVIIDWAHNFSIYDFNYDGVVNDDDVYSVIVRGDMDLDLDVDGDDVDEFVNALLLQQAPSAVVDWSAYVKRGDFNDDGLLNGLDIPAFINWLLGRSVPEGDG